MNEEQIRESNKLYQSGEYTLEELAKKYAVTIGKIRYGWKKFELPSKLSEGAKSKSMAKGALKRDNNIINKKRKNTNMERYGVENVSQLKEIKNKMLANDYVWDGDSPDMYEQDTGYYHKTISFVKERVV